MTRREWVQLALAAPLWPMPGEVVASDAFMGDYEGERKQGQRGVPMVAQVWPLGKGEYQIQLLPEFDQRCPVLGLIKGQLADGRVRFSQDGWTGEIASGRMTGEKGGPFSLKHSARLSPALGAKPSAGAVVLFDGKDLAKWEGVNNRGETGPTHWRAEDGVIKPMAPNREPATMRHMVTKDVYPAYRMHMEFRSPIIPEARGQMRGNSGIVFEDYSYHELQILDSYGLPSYYDDCGGIYKVAAPLVNMCAPPGQWQTYEIDYRAARYDGSLKLLSTARLTVKHNGKYIHRDLELPDTPAGEKLRADQPKSRRVGRIRLTYHNDPVEFRNIWLAPA